ncbi:MAG TPA: glycosyltransferase family 4 protein [Pyrinomonadaceae bacterium]|nr:glycosyltransferase family 4 protein [Pyrinomonadaceae bacterium]
MNIALVVHDLQDHPGHSLYTKVLANGLSRNHAVTVFANSFEQRNGARWSSQHVHAWRGSALASVHTFPLGMRAHASVLSDFQIQHSQGYCGGNPNVVTAHICVEAYLASLREVSMRHRLSLQSMAAAEKRFYRSYQGKVIAVSQKVADELQTFYGFNRPIAVIPHGVDLARFNGDNHERHRASLRRHLGIEQEQTMALYVGDLTKAHAYLKEIAAVTPAVMFVIVTASRAYHWTAPNVQILPPASNLETYYAAADAFVFPTTYDSFGMVVLEAMASGLPVFSSDQVGAAEFIESGTDGFVVPLRGWVDATTGQLSDRELLNRVGRDAGKTAAQHDWNSVVAAVEQVYFEVASE